MMKTLSKLGIKCLLLLLVLMNVSCSKKYAESYKGYAFIQVYDIEGGKSNINIYLLDKYSKGMSFEQNIEEVTHLKTIIFTVESNSCMWKYVDEIKQLKKERMSNELVYYLVYLDFKLIAQEDLQYSSFDSKLNLRDKVIDITVRHYLYTNKDFNFMKFLVLEPLVNYDSSLLACYY